jgi:signal transduction histidine kinase
VAGLALFFIAKQQREQIARTALEISRALTTAVDAELERSLSAITALSVARALDDADLVRFHSAMSDVLRRDPTWLTILLAEPSGKLLMDAARPLGAPLGAVVEKDSFAQVVRTRQPSIGHLARGVSEVWAVPLRVPVIRGNELRYVLTAVIRTDGIRRVIDRQQLPADWVVSVFDDRGLRAARSRQHEESLGSEAAPSLKELMRSGRPEATGMTYALEGDRVYSAYTRSPMTDWTVAVGIPADLIETAVWRSLLTYGSGIMLSIALGVLAAVFIGRGIAQPIAKLGASARALGRRAALELPATNIAEIRQVADSLAVAADERARGEAEREELLRRAEQARAIAEEANRSKDEFLAMLGHELRNPLGAIANAAQLLDARDGETRAHARGVIGRQVQHLARMTDDLLDAARAMTGKILLQREPLDLAEAAAHALSALRASGRTGQRRLAQQLQSVWVDADPTRLEQIIGNLLGNAIKFTPEGGTITVSVAREGDDALLRVADTGIGMPPELTARVFDPFVQGERPLDRSQGGLGIGLTLVRRLAELHGGTAIAASTGPGRGSVFTVRLPAIEPPARSHARPAGEAGAATREVLIVEDNADARDTLKRMLELDGHRVRVAVDGPTALAALQAAVPDVALIDIGLPQMDGYELARRIRAELNDRRPLLVAVTGYGLPEDRRRAHEAGFDFHLVKPVDFTQLADVLTRR